MLAALISPGSNESQGGGGLKLLPGAIGVVGHNFDYSSVACRRKIRRFAFWVNTCSTEFGGGSSP